MSILYTIVEFFIIVFILLYAYHLYYYLGLRQGRKNGVKTKAEIVEYEGKSTAWAEENKTFFELVYRKKRFHKYLVQFEDTELNMTAEGALIVNDHKLSKGQIVDIKYVMGKKGRLHIVQEETVGWFSRRVLAYTLLILCVFVVGICKGYSLI